MLAKVENKHITSEIEIILNGSRYKEITYDDGEKILKKHYPKSNLWVTLKFSSKDDSKVLQDIKDISIMKMVCV